MLLPRDPPWNPALRLLVSSCHEPDPPGRPLRSDRGLPFISVCLGHAAAKQDRRFRTMKLRRPLYSFAPYSELRCGSRTKKRHYFNRSKFAFFPVHVYLPSDVSHFLKHTFHAIISNPRSSWLPARDPFTYFRDRGLLTGPTDDATPEPQTPVPAPPS